MLVKKIKTKSDDRYHHQHWENMTFDYECMQQKKKKFIDSW